MFLLAVCFSYWTRHTVPFLHEGRVFWVCCISSISHLFWLHSNSSVACVSSQKPFWRLPLPSCAEFIASFWKFPFFPPLSPHEIVIISVMSDHWFCGLYSCLLLPPWLICTSVCHSPHPYTSLTFKSQTYYFFYPKFISEFISIHFACYFEWIHDLTETDDCGSYEIIEMYKKSIANEVLYPCWKSLINDSVFSTAVFVANEVWNGSIISSVYKTIHFLGGHQRFSNVDKSYFLTALKRMSEFP